MGAVHCCFRLTGSAEMSGANMPRDRAACAAIGLDAGR